MLVLTIDTSTPAVTAGLVEIDSHRTAVVAEHVVLNPRGHGELLAPAIENVLATAFVTPRQVQAVVAGTGPGPYTGLRVGLVTAAVLGLTLGIPTYGICSLDAIAAVHADAADLLVATDARRKEIYWARLRRRSADRGPGGGPSGRGPALGRGGRHRSVRPGRRAVLPVAARAGAGRAGHRPGRGAVAEPDPAVPAPPRRDDARSPETRDTGDTVTGTVSVVAMTRQHVEAVMTHEREMFGPEAWTRGGYLAEIADTRNRYYVAAQDDAGTLLGWAGILIVPPSAEVLTVGTVPQQRRQGIATALVTHLVEHARARGITELFLEVREDNEGAQALYRAQGFEPVGRRPGYYEHGRLAAVVMRREL